MRPPCATGWPSSARPGGSRPTQNATASTGTDTGKPALTWEFNQQALQVEAATDGWYALLTNLDPAEADTPGVLHRFKGQDVSERRYGNYKGPLAVAPLFVRHNRRIEALITVTCVALLVFPSVSTSREADPIADSLT
jgi:hypothetical protein